jgi:hypothetical protein
LHILEKFIFHLKKIQNNLNGLYNENEKKQIIQNEEDNEQKNKKSRGLITNKNISDKKPTKAKKFEKSNTIMLVQRSESFKKPLFTITPSTTLLNLPNILLSSQTIKEIVNPMSTVKIYYDEIIDEKKKIGIKGDDNTNKNNENEDKYILRKKIIKEKKLSLTSENFLGCSIYDKIMKYNEMESKGKVIKEEIIETERKNLSIHGKGDTNNLINDEINLIKDAKNSIYQGNNSINQEKKSKNN